MMAEKEQGDSFSYGTCLRTILTDPRDPSRKYSVGNITSYSTTTEKHQDWFNVRSCDILVDNLPKKATPLDLRARALAFLMGLD